MSLGFPVTRSNGFSVDGRNGMRIMALCSYDPVNLRWLLPSTSTGGISSDNGQSYDPSSGLDLVGICTLDTASGTWVPNSGSLGNVIGGAGVPSSAVGSNNQYYIDYTDQVIYGPKTAGAWPATPAVGGGTPISQFSPITAKVTFKEQLPAQMPGLTNSRISTYAIVKAVMDNLVVSGAALVSQAAPTLTGADAGAAQVYSWRRGKGMTLNASNQVTAWQDVKASSVLNSGGTPPTFDPNTGGLYFANGLGYMISAAANLSLTGNSYFIAVALITAQSPTGLTMVPDLTLLNNLTTTGSGNAKNNFLMYRQSGQAAGTWPDTVVYNDAGAFASYCEVLQGSTGADLQNVSVLIFNFNSTVGINKWENAAALSQYASAGAGPTNNAMTSVALGLHVQGNATNWAVPQISQLNETIIGVEMWTGNVTLQSNAALLQSFMLSPA